MNRGKRGRGSYKHLMKLAQKKPRLQEIIDNLNIFTEEEIEEIKFPKWVKDHLLWMKEKGTTSSSQSEAERIAEIMVRKSLRPGSSDGQSNGLRNHRS